MADKVIKVCNRCGKELEPNPLAGDLQSGPVEIRFPGFAASLDLDEECMKLLYEEFGRHGERSPAKGAAPRGDLLKYLPVMTT